jgi:hypothetical protein
VWEGRGRCRANKKTLDDRVTSLAVVLGEIVR